MGKLNQISKSDFIRIIIEDRFDGAWEYMHFIREWVATLERGEKGSSWESAILDGIGAINAHDSKALDQAIEKLTLLSGQ